jgi:FtsW/RodA/SpoVE-like cell cycle protein
VRVNFRDQGRALGGGGLTLREKVLRIPWLFVLAICAAAGVGIVMLYSAAGGTAEPWAIRQAARFGVALGIMLMVTVSGIQLWLRWAYPFYFVALSLLLIVDLVGTIGMGAQRWIDLGIINLQPSEVMKIALVLALAAPPGSDVSRAGGRSARRRLSHPAIEDRAGLGRRVRQGITARHAEPPQLPAGEADGLHLHDAGRGIRADRLARHAGDLCRHSRPLPTGSRRWRGDRS